jgi:hypothetical protein
MTTTIANGQQRKTLEAYADLLAEEKARLERELAAAAEGLRGKVASLSHLGTPEPVA